ncbi:MAG: hypothetical protein V1808_00955 [Candidatus Daviesbacteria bacterium]
MENLAGSFECDFKIRQELDQAGIRVIKLRERSEGEVPATLVGKLGNIYFARSWSYWVVEGEIPLEAAKEMYADLIGKEDVRVAGHCGCPPPEDWAKHYDIQGKELCPSKEEEYVLDLEAKKRKSRWDRKWIQEIRSTTRYVENPAKEAFKSVVDLYHIDSQEGLNLYAATARKFNLDFVASVDASEGIDITEQAPESLPTEWTLFSKKQRYDYDENEARIPYTAEVFWLPVELDYPDNIVNKLVVSVRDNTSIDSISKSWKSKKSDNGGVVQYYFKHGEPVGYNFGMISGPGFSSNMPLLVDNQIWPLLEDLKKLKPKIEDSLDRCLFSLDLYSGKSS